MRALSSAFPSSVVPSSRPVAKARSEALPKSADGFDAPSVNRQLPALNTPAPRVITGDVTVNSAADLAALRGVGEITGRLIIGPGVTSLAGLEALTQVGALTIEGTSLTSLDGLGGLARVRGDLSIVGNDQLRSLAALRSLESVGGNFSIGARVTHDGAHGFITDVVSPGNASLTELGLSRLTSVGGHLSIGGNPALASLGGLESLGSVGGSLDILYNASLRNLDGLAGLHTVGRLQVGHDRLIQSPSAGRYVLLPAGNDQLERAELPALRNARDVVIHANDALTQLSLPQLGAAGAVDSVRVTTNPRLSGLSLPALETVGELIIEQGQAPNVKDSEGNLLYAPPHASELREVSLPRLRTVTGNLNFGLLQNLERLELPELQSVGGDFLIQYAPRLPSFSAPALTQVGGIVGLVDVEALADLNGLRGLTRAGALHISYAPSLSSLEGLAALRQLDGGLSLSWIGAGDLAPLLGIQRLGSLEVTENPGLTDDAARAFAEALRTSAGFTGGVTIRDNGPMQG